MPADRSRGFALIGALFVAILFFLIVAVLMTDLMRVTRSSATGRSRIVSESLAESGAELAVRHMMLGLQSNFSQDLPEGSFEARWQRFDTNLPDVFRFEIRVQAKSRTLPPHISTLDLDGMYRAGEVEIRRSSLQTTIAVEQSGGQPEGPEE